MVLRFLVTIGEYNGKDGFEEAKVWLYKKPYDMFKAQLVQIGTDENVLK